MSHDGSSAFFSLFFHLCGSASGPEEEKGKYWVIYFFFVRV